MLGDGRDMQSLPLVRYILRDEAVTRGLGDCEASLITDWLAYRAEQIAERNDSEIKAWAEVYDLCRRARLIGRFVYLWSNPGDRGAAIQLVANEQLHWPLPKGDLEPIELMLGLLRWIDQQDEMKQEPLVRRAA
jgi:hypothetical protein